MSVRAVAACVAVFAVLAVPAAASAAVKVVNLGVPPSGQKQFGKLPVDVNAFFPASTTVVAGDSIRFLPVGFHTLDLPAAGGSAVDLLTGHGVTSGSKDAAGAPFWFNAQPKLGFTPSLQKGLFGKTVTYDGTRRIEGGLPLSEKPKPITVKFTKPGTFTFYCNVHAGMKGTVKVLGKGRAAPSAAVDDARIKAQVAAAVGVAKKLGKTTPAADTVSVGASGKGGVESFAFYPSKLAVKPGTTVTFAMSADTLDIHTATTGPGDPEKKPKSYLGKLAASLNENEFDQAAVYPSDPATGSAELTPTLHGNGFWSSGIMDLAAAGKRTATSAKVTFKGPGTYQFFCMIHPFMHATVTVK